MKTQEQLSETKQLTAIGKLAPIVAHELRNPPGVIRAALFNIEEKTKDSQVLQHIATIEKKIDESEHFIDNLLSYSFIKKQHIQKHVLSPC